MGEIVVKTRIIILILAVMAFMASCGKYEPSSCKEGSTVPVEFRFSVDTLGQSKGTFSGYGNVLMFKLSISDTIYAKPYYRESQQEEERTLSAQDNFIFKGNWRVWNAGMTFNFYCPASLGRTGYLSLKNQLVDNTRHYALKGMCRTVRVGAVNDATLQPLGAVLRVRLFENKKISINARDERGRFVVGIDSTGTAIFAPPEATAEDCVLLSADRTDSRTLSSSYHIVVPAGIKLSFYDGDTKLKTTRSIGFIPGTWATITIGEDIPTRVKTLDVTELSTFEATLHGIIESDNLEDIVKVWFGCSSNKENLVLNNGIKILNANLEQDGSFSCKYDTYSNTTYYYAAFAQDKRDNVIRMGDILSFKSLPFRPKYTLEGDPLSYIGVVSAGLANNIKTDDPYVQSAYVGGGCYYSKTFSERADVIQRGTFGGLTGLERGTTYYFVPVYYIKSTKDDNQRICGDVYSFTTKSSDAELGEAVDLGLSVKWRSLNIGAAQPYEIGELYSWGETTEPLSGEDYDKYNSHGGSLILSKEDDTAHYRMGGYWRMPTLAEAEELRKKCTISYVEGRPPHYIVRSLVQGYTDKYIILPVTNDVMDFWTSSLDPYSNTNAYLIRRSPTQQYYFDSRMPRAGKYPIRPVYCDKEN